jgi:hypothetical protein
LPALREVRTMPNGPMAERLRRERVVVFGAGIAGLSAAHELAERDFEVHVVEACPDPLKGGHCQVGGMARTQWSRFPTTEFFGELARAGMRRARPPIGLDWLFNPTCDDTPEQREAKKRLRYDDDLQTGPEKAVIYFAHNSHRLDAKAKARLSAIAGHILAYVENHVRVETVVPHWEAGDFVREETPAPEILYVDGYRAETERAPAAGRRADAVAEELKKLLHAVGGLVDVVAGPVDGVAASHLESSDVRNRCVRLHFREVLLPGEHGYRFFPSFYRHLFDVMARTSIVKETQATPEKYAERQKDATRVVEAQRQEPSRLQYVDTGSTVRGNLVSTEYHSIEQDDHDVAEVLPRRRPPSVTALVRMLRAMQKDMRFESLDLARYGLKLLQYLTSHPDRRAGEYERMSWAEFVGVERYSKKFQEALDLWPQALVGMRSQECDARTAGNVTTQMVLDQLLAQGFRDGTLNASTSEAWLDHWKVYLESQGVTFHLGRLRKIRWNGRLERLVAETDIPVQEKGLESQGYWILALPLEEAARLVRDLRDDPTLPADLRAGYFAEGSDLERLAGFLDPEREDYHKGPEPDGPFEHFNGIQFYLLHDFSLVRGHTYYASSPWGLTSISQTQFRVERPDWHDDYRGIVSVDIGSWSRDGQRHRKPAWQCTRDEIAQEIWYQIATRVKDRSKATPMPVWYHIDDDMEWGADGRPARNRTPYLLTRPGEWERRPGKPGRVGFTYDVSCEAPHLKGIVLAGNYMKTFTRLGTMEAANESARHAVNSLLAHWRDRMGEAAEGRVPQWCRYWDVEDHELADLGPLKQIDRRLFARGLPHFLEILEVERFLALEWPFLTGSAPAPPEALGEFFQRILDLAGGGAPDWLAGVNRSLHTFGALLGLLADWLKEDRA